MKAKSGDIVSVHYIGKLTNGIVFDTSKDRDPLSFEIGAGQMIPGFENAIIDMEIDQTKELLIPCDQAYGPHKEALISEIPKTSLPPDLDPQIDEQIVIEDNSGNEIHAIVIEINEDTITLDTNHPLAGEDLIFKIILLDITRK
ncbi:peptidylprolyl isomerase [Candidatus Margulisiibacteriota bacterium]